MIVLSQTSVPADLFVDRTTGHSGQWSSCHTIGQPDSEPGGSSTMVKLLFDGFKDNGSYKEIPCCMWAGNNQSWTSPVDHLISNRPLVSLITILEAPSSLSCCSLTVLKMLVLIKKYPVIREPVTVGRGPVQRTFWPVILPSQYPPAWSWTCMGGLWSGSRFAPTIFRILALVQEIPSYLLASSN